MLKLSSAEPELAKLTFVLPVDDVPGPVSVLGDFNGWDPLAHPLKRRSNGTRSVSVQVQSGTQYQFKYLAEDGTWFCDPDVEDLAPNEYGELNCVVRLD